MQITFINVTCDLLGRNTLIHHLIPQEELYKIVHVLLVNSETREAAMTYIATCLERNNKKSQFQVTSVI